MDVEDGWGSTVTIYEASDKQARRLGRAETASRHISTSARRLGVATPPNVNCNYYHVSIGLERSMQKSRRMGVVIS